MSYNVCKSKAHAATYFQAPLLMVWLKATKWTLKDRLLDGFSQHPIDLNGIDTSQSPGCYLRLKTFQQNQYELEINRSHF